MGGMGAARGVHLGGVGVQGDDVRTSLDSATSLVGLTVAGVGGTRAALNIGVGVGVGSPRGVVVVEVLPSEFRDLAAEGEGAREFSCPLAAEIGGTEIQASFSLGMMIGKMIQVRMNLPVSGSSSSIS